MSVSQKCQYGLRALFHLAKTYGQGPIKIADIAEKQAIPKRFLEVILSQLKQGGFVSSVRGNEGGYILERDPESLAVGEIIRFVEGPLAPVGCLSSEDKTPCPLTGRCIFMPMWQRVREVVEDVYDNTTFLALVEQERELVEQYVPQYAI